MCCSTVVSLVIPDLRAAEYERHRRGTRDARTAIGAAADCRPVGGGLDGASGAGGARWLRAAQPAWFAHPRLLDRLEVLHVSRTLGCLQEPPGSALRLGHLRAVLAGTSYLRRQLGSR